MQARADGQEQEATRNALEAVRLQGVEERLKTWDADLIARENAHESLEERYGAVMEAYQIVDYNRRMNEGVLREVTEKLEAVRTEYAACSASLETLRARKQELVASLEGFRRDVVLPYLYCSAHSTKESSRLERSDKSRTRRGTGESPGRSRTSRSSGESRESRREERRATSPIPPLRIRTRYVVAGNNAD